MDADADAECGAEIGGELGAERAHRVDHRAGSRERLARAGGRARVDPEERHHPVAGELVRDPAGPRDRRADGLEVAVQDEHDVIGQLVLGHPGEAAQVSKEDRQLLLASLANVGAERFGRRH